MNLDELVYSGLDRGDGRDARGRAPESGPGRRGGSPLQACALRPVTEDNCVAVRRGGEQSEGERSVRRMTNAIRPDVAVSLRPSGEAPTESDREDRRRSP